MPVLIAHGPNRGPARDEQGASAVEHGLVVTAIAALHTVVLALGGVTLDLFSGSCTLESKAMTGARC